MKSQRRAKTTPVTLLAASIGLALQMAALAGPGAASAREPAASDTAAADAGCGADRPHRCSTTVTVTGFRGSLEKALEIKRSETGVVDAIVAEDIADFPDLNLAESLQRIPGVSIARDAGEGRQISVRGLDSHFTRVRINGMEALTTTGGTDSSGGANRGRGFDFNVFASELFNSITVRKTASAEIEEGSLGATVDLQTRASVRLRRLHLRHRRAAAATTTWPDDCDPRGADADQQHLGRRQVRRAGLGGLHRAQPARGRPQHGALGHRHQQRRLRGAPRRSRRAPRHDLPSAHPALRRAGARAGAPGRHRLAAVRAQRPHVSAWTCMYADFDATRTENFLEAMSFSRTGARQAADRGASTASSTPRRRPGLRPVRQRRRALGARYDELETKFTQFSFNGSTTSFTDDFSMHGLVGRAKSEFDNPIQTTITIDRSTRGLHLGLPRQRPPAGDHYGFDVTDPAQLGVHQRPACRRKSACVRSPRDNTFDNGQLDFDWDVDRRVPTQGRRPVQGIRPSTPARAPRVRDWSVPALPAGTTLADLTTPIGLGRASTQPRQRHAWLIPDIDAFDRAVRHLQRQRHLRGQRHGGRVRGNNRA